ncbi:hypothetical protein ACFYZN_34410 [Streptomyces sp. NPDC001777]|uniref:hypothetical protein n=1 Tax=Streptomyces sp. NPDC001777 TaxID=3364608 RepID=UPI003677965B
MDVNVHELMSLPAGQRYRLLADRLNACRLWAYEDLFPSVFADAVDLVYARQEQHLNARRFVEHTFINLITRPGDLVELCRRIPAEDLRLAVVEAYVRHPLVAHDVLAAMGASGELYRELPPGGWTEVPMHLYASARLDAEPGRRFELHELLPFGTVHDRSSARSVLRSALEADQLTDQARAAVLSPGGVEIPAPAFHEGQRAQVVLNDRNRTPRRGAVRDKVWHHRDQQWYFFLRDDSGRKISKRYSAADLQARCF